MSKHSIFCSDRICNTKIQTTNPLLFQCNICLLPFCSQLCLINHISLTHKENHIKSKGTIIPKSSLYQSNSYYDIENFEKVKINNKNKILGHGAFGSVYLVRHKTNNTYYAIKIIKKEYLNNVIEDSIIHREFNIHIMLSHENICKLYAYREDKENFYMILEYECNGTLFSEIQRSKGRLSEDKAYEYFVQICNAVLFLHNNDIIHRDIKPENCLLDINKKIKLCDFGWTTRVSSKMRTTFCGTFEYMAPEIIKEHPYSKSVDIWSLGIILYEMLHGFSPFRGNGNPKEIMSNIIKGKWKFQRHDLSEDVIQLISALLLPDENNRINIEGIFESKWIKKRSQSNVTRFSNDVLFDSVFNLITKRKRKEISPIVLKTEENVSMYKEIKEIEKALNSQEKEINQFKKKAKLILHQAKHINYTNNSILLYPDNTIKQKQKKSKKKPYYHSLIESYNSNDISTQTEISKSSKWDILNIFNCG